ncbi:MAG: FIST C-terminal domain-containing protein [Deltaproteobacteria bacterium]|nr:FIST C-terminal domain-containing protein [Deltaproteobacteria bacterium]
MATKVGVSCTDDLLKVGSSKYLLESAISSACIDNPSVVFAFASGSIDPTTFFEEIREALGPYIPIVGGSAIGVMSNSFLSYRKNCAGILVLQSDIMNLTIKCDSGLNFCEEKAAERLMKKFITDIDFETKLFMILYDSLKQPKINNLPPIMNSSFHLLKGIKKNLNTGVPVCGAGLIGDYEFSSAYQFCGDHVGMGHLIGILFRGKIKTYYRIMHGCTPLDGIYRKITKIEGPILYEIDGKPVVQMINELLGDEDWQKENPVDFLTIGVNYGERYGPYDEEAYVNRLIIGVTPDKKGVLLFEPDLEEGMEIQLMTRDSERMVESAKKNANVLLSSILQNGEIPLFGIYIDCAGRAAEYLKIDVEEAWEVQKVLNAHNVPLFGFYSGVEIAPLLGESRGLDWTGVLIIFTEER